MAKRAAARHVPRGWDGYSEPQGREGYFEGVCGREGHSRSRSAPAETARHASRRGVFQQPPSMLARRPTWPLGAPPPCARYPGASWSGAAWRGARARSCSRPSAVTRPSAPSCTRRAQYWRAWRAQFARACRRCISERCRGVLGAGRWGEVPHVDDALVVALASGGLFPAAIRKHAVRSPVGVRAHRGAPVAGGPRHLRL